MKPDEALALATTLTACFSAPKETAASFAWAIRDFDFAPMQRAVKKAMVERDRMPSLKALLGAYYGERRADRTEASASGEIPCEVCKRLAVPEPKPATPPFIRGFSYPEEGPDGKPVDRIAWAHESACVSHSTHVSWAARALLHPSLAYCAKFPAALFGARWLAANPPPPHFNPIWLEQVHSLAATIDKS